MESYYIWVYLTLLLTQSKWINVFVVLVCGISSIFSVQIHDILLPITNNFYMTQEVINMTMILILGCVFISEGTGYRILCIITTLVLCTAVNMSIDNNWLLADTFYNHYRQINLLAFELMIVFCIDRGQIQKIGVRLKTITIPRLKLFLKKELRIFLQEYRSCYDNYATYLFRFSYYRVSYRLPR